MWRANKAAFTEKVSSTVRASLGLWNKQTETETETEKRKFQTTSTCHLFSVSLSLSLSLSTTHIWVDPWTHDLQQQQQQKGQCRSENNVCIGCLQCMSSISFLLCGVCVRMYNCNACIRLLGMWLKGFKFVNSGWRASSLSTLLCRLYSITRTQHTREILSQLLAAMNIEERGGGERERERCIPWCTCRQAS